MSFDLLLGLVVVVCVNRFTAIMATCWWLWDGLSRGIPIEGYWTVVLLVAVADWYLYVRKEFVV